MLFLCFFIAKKINFRRMHRYNIKLLYNIVKMSITLPAYECVSDQDVSRLNPLTLYYTKTII